MRALGLVFAMIACTPPRGPTPVRSARPDLRYTLERVAATSPRLRITVELAAAPDGTTTFDLDPWELVDRPDEMFQTVTATAAGRAVPVEHTPHAWVVRSAPGAALVVHYEIPTDDEVDRLERRFQPIVRAHLVHLYGGNALISPHHVDDHRPRTIALAWAGFAGWTTLSSHGAEARSVVTVSLEDFRDAEFLASDRVHVMRRQVGDTALIAALVDATWPFGVAELTDVTSRLMAAETALIGEAFPRTFLVDLLPVRRDGSWGGTALYHAFVAQTSVSPLVDHGRRPITIAWTFAHELFHTWNGRTITPTVEDGEKWFTEGFTNFYARRIMVRAGLATVDDYVTVLDTTIADYTTSPLRNQPSAAYAVADRHQQAMAYTRGDLVAVAVDTEIRHASAGKRSLDDVMRDLVADARAGGKIDAASLLDRFARETSPGFAARLRGVIERGDTLELDPAGFAPCLHGELVETEPFDLGFDFDASAAAHRVIGLRAGSPAEAAGAREADALNGWSFVGGARTEQTVVLHVRRDGVEHKVAFVPKGPKVPILTFQVGDASACPGRL